MFVFNLTGTLLKQTNTISEEVILQIKNIYKKNHLIAITTNKSYKYSLGLMEPIIDYMHFFIGNNGAILIDKIKNTTFKTSKTLNNKFVNNILKDVEILGGVTQIITSKCILISSDKTGLKAENWLSEEMKNKYINPYKKYDIHSLKKNEVIQLTLILSDNLINELSIFFKKFYGPDYEYRISSDTTLDISVTGINKYEGIKTIIMLYKIDIDNVFCFGDSENDIELIKNIKNSYVLENSNIVVKKLSKYIISGNISDTLAIEIKKILKK